MKKISYQGKIKHGKNKRTAREKAPCGRDELSDSGSDSDTISSKSNTNQHQKDKNKCPQFKPDYYYQKKISMFFKKYPEEELRIENEDPKQYGWMKRLPIPDSNNSDDNQSYKESIIMLINSDDDSENTAKSESIPSLVVMGRKKKEGDAPKCNQTLSTALSSITVVKLLSKGRVNWEQGQDSQRISDAIEKWLEGTGLALDKGGNKIKLSSYCQIVGISYKTFLKYVTKDPNKCCKISHGQGPASLLK